MKCFEMKIFNNPLLMINFMVYSKFSRIPNTLSFDLFKDCNCQSIWLITTHNDDDNDDIVQLFSSSSLAVNDDLS